MAFKLQTLFKPTLICFFTFIFSASASATTSLYHKFQACAPRNCGHGPDISSPFWIDGVHEPSCGHPDFKIECNDQNHPVLEISDENYIVEDIIYQNCSSRLVSTAAYGDKHSQDCSHCEQSDVYCSFENNQLKCYCSDGSHFKSCKHGILGCVSFYGLLCYLRLKRLFCLNLMNLLSIN